MLMVERTNRIMYSAPLADTKMPTMNKMVLIVFPNPQKSIGIWWTKMKSPEGKRLFNVGEYKDDGTQPENFRM